MEKLCCDCKFMDVEHEWESAFIVCRKQHFETASASALGIRAVIRRAETCPDYREGPPDRPTMTTYGMAVPGFMQRIQNPERNERG